MSANFTHDNFTVFANTEFEPSGEWGRRKNLEVRSVVPTGRGKRAFWEFFGSTRQVRTGDYDVWFSTTHAVPLGHRVPSVAIIHDMIPLLFPEFQDWSQSAYLRLALVYVAKKANVILTNSEQTKSDIVRLAKVSANKVVVVPFGPGAQLVARDPASIQPDELADIPYKRFFFSLGTLEPRKNLGKLFEALATLEDPETKDVGLVIGGGKGWRENGIFETLEKLGVGNRVHFLGYVPEERLATLFAASQGFVFPSLYEGFGMPLVESMQLGTIALTGRSGAMREVVGDAALLFDPNDPLEIANAMRNCLDLSGFERAALAEKAMARSAQFNWDDAAIQTHKMLEELVGRS